MEPRGGGERVEREKTQLVRSVTGPRFDVVIRDGLVVTDESATQRDVGIRDGLIAQMGGEMLGETILDATDRLVVPGGVDMHVHLTSPVNVEWHWVDDFTSGTRAAAAGGVTTVGNMTSRDPAELTVESLERVSEMAERCSLVDYTLHPVLDEFGTETREQLEEVAALGYSSVKVFTDNREAFSADWCQTIEKAAALSLTVMAHCEDGTINRVATQQLKRIGATGVEHFADSRPESGEALAARRMVALAALVDASVYLVHLSSAAALEAIRQEQRGRSPVFVETRPAHVHLTRDRYNAADGAQNVCFPPLRDAKDQKALWEAMASGEVTAHCSDHAPLDHRQILAPHLDVATFVGAMPAVETLRPLLFSEGVRKGRISLQRWVELTATGPARALQIYPQKGALELGSDADVVIWDPSRTRAVRSDAMRSRADFDAFEGWTVTGWPDTTISRGEIIYHQGKITSHGGRGRRITRQQAKHASPGLTDAIT